MISVIVPVYNVERYLKKCLDSIIAQTYKDLEILLIDDGSTDRSGRICNEYISDSRVRVFHTKNHGLSAARNFGLANARGSFIAFVDSDDWIEPNMYEFLIRKAEETGADVVECGVLQEYKKTVVLIPAIEIELSGKEALEALVRGKIQTQVWNKIFRANLFDSVTFPDGCSFEDIATTHKLLMNARVVGVSNFGYHYTQRESSISQTHDIKNLIDYWHAYLQRYEDLKGTIEDEILLKDCASAIARMWAWYLKNQKTPEIVMEMTTFVREQLPPFGFDDWPGYLRTYTYLARFNNTISFSIAYILNQIYRLTKPQYYD